MLLQSKNLIEKNFKVSTNLIKELKKENIFDSKWNNAKKWFISENTNNGDYVNSDEYKSVKNIFKEQYT